MSGAEPGQGPHHHLRLQQSTSRLRVHHSSAMSSAQRKQFAGLSSTCTLKNKYIELNLTESITLNQHYCNLETHTEERRGSDLWRVNQNNVVNFLRQACRMEQQFTEEEIHEACGAIDVNSFEIKCVPSGSRIAGILPVPILRK